MSTSGSTLFVIIFVVLRIFNNVCIAEDTGCALEGNSRKCSDDTTNSVLHDDTSVEKEDDALDDKILNKELQKRKDNNRTWRLNRKALVPILIGIALKGLLLIPMILTGLSITGAIAILVSKTSLVISAFMFLKRFFSHEKSSGGFFGLNPLMFPSAHLQHQQHGYQQHGYQQPDAYATGNRRWSRRPSRRSTTAEDILPDITRYQESLIKYNRSDHADGRVNMEETN